MPRRGMLSLAVFCLLALTGCGSGTGEGVVVGEVGAALDQYLTRITPFGFSGAVLVAKDGEVVLDKGYGLASVAEGSPNTRGTVFTTGSITKQFTAAAIMALEADGVLSADDLLSAHIDGVPEDKAGIRLHHLMTHTAGVVASTGDDYEEVGRDEVVRRVLDAPLLFEPGTAMSYSNAGYSLLAAVIEIASGRPYEEFLSERLLAPAGMQKTGYRLPDWRGERLAHWYVGAIDNGVPLDRPFPYWNILGNGGILSTTGDMFLWYEALKAGEMFSLEARERLLTPFLNGYACGWEVRETEHGKVIQHNGANTLGASAEFRWFPDADVLIVAFCNRSFGGAPLTKAVRNDIATIAFGGDVAVPPAVSQAAGGDLEGLAADYRLPTGGRLRLQFENGELAMITFDQDAINALFLPDAEDPFIYQDLNNRANRLVGAAVSGNSAFFVSDLGDERTAMLAEMALRHLVGRFAEATGAGPRAAIGMGTVPMDHEGLVLTSVRLRNELDSTGEIGFLWRDGRLAGIDDTGYEVRFPVMTASDGGFVGYHLGFGKTVRLSFEPLGDQDLGEMVIGGHRATRLTTHSHDHEAQ